MKEMGYGQGYKYTPEFKHPEEAQQSNISQRDCEGEKYVTFSE
jgi:replication-associated recombination protein RarA